MITHPTVLIRHPRRKPPRGVEKNYVIENVWIHPKKKSKFVLTGGKSISAVRVNGAYKTRKKLMRKVAPRKPISQVLLSLIDSHGS